MSEENNTQPATTQATEAQHNEVKALVEGFLKVIEDTDPEFSNVFTALGMTVVGSIGDAAILENDFTPEYSQNFLDNFTDYTEILLPGLQARLDVVKEVLQENGASNG